MELDITQLTFDERDEFKRKSIAENAIRLLTDEKLHISPMVIDGSWGTGKTEFCLKLINLIKQKETHSVIYIDAFKADHIDEPLMTVLAEIVKVLPNDKRGSFIKKVIPTVRFSLKTIAKAGVSHILRQDIADVVSDYDEHIENATDKAIDATAELLLKDHIEAEKNLKTLQEALITISANKPIIIFVDELDRCKPSFAIEMLEIIKHTFDVKGVQFVLVTNTEQLKASINHCYGSDVDAQRYLDKFIKFRFELSPYSQRNNEYSNSASVDYFFQLMNQLEVINSNHDLHNSFYHASKDLIHVRDLSLREVDTLVSHMKICQILSNSNTFTYDGFGLPVLTIINLITVALACFNPQLLRKLNNNAADAKELGEFLGVKKLRDIENGRIYAVQNKVGSSVSHVFEVIMYVISKVIPDETNVFKLTDEQLDEWDSHIKQNYHNVDPEYILRQISKTSKLLSLE